MRMPDDRETPMTPSLRTIPALPALALQRPTRHARSSTNPPRTSVGTRPDGTRRFFARSRTPPHFAPSHIASRTAGARRGFSMMICFRDAISRRRLPLMFSAWWSCPPARFAAGA